MQSAELQQKCLALEMELRDKESELTTLRQLAQDLSQDVQAAKVIELSKKVIWPIHVKACLPRNHLDQE